MPTKQYSQLVDAGTPPTVTVTFCGAGNEAKGMFVPGAAPVAMDGDTAPEPVRYKLVIWLRVALALGTIWWLPSVKMPGEAAATVKVCDTVLPLLLTARVA